MSIEHHPTDSMLAAFAAGTLDHGQHIAIATHLVSCPQCRAFMRSMEQVGGAVLTSLPPAAMSNGALAAVEARLNEPVRPAAADMTPTVPETEVPGLPKFVRRYRVRKLEVDRAVRAFAADRAALCKRYAGVFAQVRSWDKDASAHSHRDSR